MTTAKARAEHFVRLHQPENDILIIPNAWDTGTARIFEAMGFEAIATTSAGHAYSAGKLDWPGEVERKDALAFCKSIVRATDLPVSADLENGFGARPDTVAETIRQAARTGLAGCTIEDTTGDRDEPIFDFSHAVDRIAAACEARDKLKRPFVLTARAENFLHGRADLDDTISRLIAFEAVGADVLYAPGLKEIEQIEQVCEAVSKPVNVLAASGFTVEALADAGARRVSVGSSFARVAIGAYLQAAREVRDRGTFEYLGYAASFGEVEELLTRRRVQADDARARST